MERKTTGQKTSFTNLKDKKIRVVAVSHKRDKTGYPAEHYSNLCGAIWASYRSLSGSEYRFAMQNGSKTQVVFTINWRADIETDMYVVYRDKIYSISYIDDLEGYKKDLKLHCETSSNLNKSVKDEILKAIAL